MTTHQDIDTALAIARVCAEEADMRTLLARTGDAEPLAQFVEAARSSADVENYALALHTELQRAGDAVGILGGTRSAVPWAIGDSRPVDVALLCPRRRCSRAEVPTAENTFHCMVFDEPMRSERI